KRQFLYYFNRNCLFFTYPRTLCPGLFKILAEFNALNTDYIQIYDHTLVVSIHEKEISVFDRSSQSI
ncbi:hypothetical protein K4O61_12160, partial [Staphylococcus epidermidis]|nr:hypothetical protein [Staphylococcus epidermidis]